MVTIKTSIVFFTEENCSTSFVATYLSAPKDNVSILCIKSMDGIWLLTDGGFRVFSRVYDTITRLCIEYL